MPIISLIAAIDNNNTIGYNGDMLCYIPSDLKRFKEITSGHAVIMGRKTFESLPNGALPNRRNIVITRNCNYKCSNCATADSLSSALKLCKNESEVFVIGGGEIYREAMDRADKLYITHINHSFDKSDAFFPEINLNDWQIKIREEHDNKEDNVPFSYTFVVYLRNS